jgi:hypothetical protein
MSLFRVPSYLQLMTTPHNELPEVTNEVSITLRLNIKSHDNYWTCVFHKGKVIIYASLEGEFDCKFVCFSILNKYIYVKGEQDPVRTPSLWLTPSKSAPHPRFSLNNDLNAGIDSVGNGLLLNRWYHLAYTLSETKKRLDFYIDGELAGVHIIQPTEQIVFNSAPLYIGNDTFYNGTTGQIRYSLL